MPCLKHLLGTCLKCAVCTSKRCLHTLETNGSCVQINRTSGCCQCPDMAANCVAARFQCVPYCSTPIPCSRAVQTAVCKVESTCSKHLKLSCCVPVVRHTLQTGRIDGRPGQFPMAMMPLGTGNDLSRTFRWGYGFRSRMLQPKFLEKVRTAVPVQLDRCVLVASSHLAHVDMAHFHASNMVVSLPTAVATVCAKCV